MTFVRAIPKLGGWSELKIYLCDRCGHVETVEVEDR